MTEMMLVIVTFCGQPIPQKYYGIDYSKEDRKQCVRDIVTCLDKKADAPNNWYDYQLKSCLVK